MDCESDAIRTDELLKLAPYCAPVVISINLSSVAFRAIPSARKLELRYPAGALTLMPFETLLLPCLVFFGKINPAPAPTFSLTDPSVHTSKSNSPRAAMVASVAVFFSSSVELFVQLPRTQR